MKAILVEQSTERLYNGVAPSPIPGDDDLLVSVKATALNRANLLQRRGKYPPPPGAFTIIGLEMSGVVEQTGKNVTGWKAGDLRLPPRRRLRAASSHSLRYGDRYTGSPQLRTSSVDPRSLFDRLFELVVLGGLKAREYVLIHAAASGVGAAAIQLARVAGAIPNVTAGSAHKLEARAV